MDKKSQPYKWMPQLLVMLILLTYSAIVIYPLLWSLYSSFKTTEEFYADPFAFPQSIYFTNYINAFQRSNMGSYFINSVFVTVTALIICNTLSFAAAYAISRYPSPILKMIRQIYMASLFFPVVFSIVPLFMLLIQLNLYDSLIGLSIVYAVSAIPFTVFLLTGFLSTIPRGYEDAAMIDGCSRYGILIRIIAPMAKPPLVTITIFNVIGFWNEYVYALSFISTESKRTLTLGLAYLMEIQRYATDWGALFAGLVIVMLPTLLLYMLLQRKITSGLNMGGLKG